MLLSLQELIVWTGMGPFEVALHSFALLFFTLLSTLQVEGVISTSWHAVFSPLYVALGLHVYHLSVVSVRMVVWGFQSTRSAKKTLAAVLAFLLTTNLAGVGVLLFVEFATAAFLNGGENPDILITSLVLLLGYLVARLCFVYRTLKSAAPGSLD